MFFTCILWSVVLSFRRKKMDDRHWLSLSKRVKYMRLHTRHRSFFFLFFFVACFHLCVQSNSNWMCMLCSSFHSVCMLFCVRMLLRGTFKWIYCKFIHKFDWLRCASIETCEGTTQKSKRTNFPISFAFFSSDISFSFIYSSVYRVFARIELDRKHHAIVFKRNKERKRTVDEMDQ